MSYFSTSTAFSDGQQVTSTLLNSITINLRLSDDSVDASTVTLNGGVLSVGVLGESNFALNTIPAGILKSDAVLAANVKDGELTNAKLANLTVEGSKMAAATITFDKLAALALGTQAELQSETASKLVAAALAKHLPFSPKSYGVVTMATGALTGAYKATGTASGSATERTINLGVTMANATWTPLITPIDAGGTIANEAVVKARTTTSITINGGATAYAFAILGQLAT